MLIDRDSTNTSSDDQNVDCREMEIESDEDSISIDCTICFQSLNAPIFKICEHPIVHTALCILCYDNVMDVLNGDHNTLNRSNVGNEDSSDEDSIYDENDRCDWCMEYDKGDIILCGDGESCRRQFCRNCLIENLGAQYVEMKVDACDQWICLSCNPEPLKDLITRRVHAYERSWYENLHFTNEELLAGEIEFDAFDGSDKGYSDEHTVGEDDIIIAKHLSLLKEILSDLKKCYNKLETENLDQIESEVRDEFRRKQVKIPSAEARIEMESYVQDVQWSIDILQRQEAECADVLEFYGINLSDIPHYNQIVRTRNLASSVESRSDSHRSNFQDLLTYQSPDLEKKLEDMHCIATHSESSDSRLPVKKFSFIPDRIEESPDLPYLLEKAAQDEIVQKYVTQKDPPDLLYPKEFENIIPKQVLKALCYADRKDKLALYSAYRIPDFASIVMNHVPSCYPKYSKYLRKLKRHPAVVKAIYHETDRAKLAILWSHYELNPEELAITDFGDAKKLYLNFQDRRNKCGKSTDTSFAEFEEFVEKEDEILIALKDILASKCHGSKNVELLQHFLTVASVTDEAADVQEFVAERQRSLSGSIFRLPAPRVRSCAKDRDFQVASIDSAMHHDLPRITVKSKDPPCLPFNDDKVELQEENSFDEVHQEDTIDANCDKTVDFQTPIITNANKKSKEDLKHRRERYDQTRQPSKSPFEVIDLVSDDESGPASISKPHSERNITVLPSSAKVPHKFFEGKLSKESKEAERQELNRRKEIDTFLHFRDLDGVSLNPRRPKGEDSVLIIGSISKAMKPHQVEGVHFLWENVAVSLEKLKQRSDESFGCLIAHCMGLGKTLTTVSFTMTLLTNPAIRDIYDPFIKDPCSIEWIAARKKEPSLSQISQCSQIQSINSPCSSQFNKKRLFHRVLIIAPKNTLQNWAAEFKKWTPADILQNIAIHVFSSEGAANIGDKKLSTIKQWFENGGILIMSYQMFRGKVSDPNEGCTPQQQHANETDKSSDERVMFQRYLQNPGPDLVIADEAHMIKNKNAKVTKTFQQIRTKRRIALTGSPLQNNLEEYWCMVDWVKHRALYKFTEYKERFMDPIKAGEHKGASLTEVREMKKRTHVLHTKLKDIVQRKDMRVLTRSDLQPKREFVLVIKMTHYQKFLYKYFISMLAGGKFKRFMFKAYQSLLRVFNHPLCAVMQYLKNLEPNRNPATSSSIGGTTDRLLETNKSSKRLKMVKPTLDELRKAIEESYAIFLNQSTAALNAIEKTANAIEDTAMTTSEQGKNKGKETKKKMKRKGSNKRRKTQANKDVEGCGVFRNLKIRTEKRTFDNNSKNAGNWVSEKVCDLVDTDDDNHQNGSDESDWDDIDDNIGSDGDYEEDDDSSSYITDDEITDQNDSQGNGSSLSSCDDHGTDEMEPDDEVIDSIQLVSPQKPTEKRKLEDCFVDGISEEIAVPPVKIKRISGNEHFNDGESVSPQTLTSFPDVDDELSNDEGAEISKGSPIDDKRRPFTPSNGQDESLLEGTFLEDEDDDDGLIDWDWWKLKTYGNSTLPMVPSSLSIVDLVMLSSKMTTLFSLLTLSVQAKDKLIVFSQSLPTLDIIELFLQSDDWGAVVNGEKKKTSSTFFGSNSTSTPRRFSKWQNKVDYVRIDGSTGNRQKVIDDFNKKLEIKVILISTKAGNMGINLQAANRVVLFDCSWNPVHDLQAIYRAYRLGQQKKVFVYRLISAGSMEEKIYKRQVQKQALAARVVDAQMPENIFTAEEQAELLTFDDKNDREAEIEKVKSVIMSGTSDEVLEKFVDRHGRDLLEYIEDNDNLLIDRADEHLNEEEQKEAEAEFEREVAASKRIPIAPVGSTIPASGIGSGGLVYGANQKAFDALVGNAVQNIHLTEMSETPVTASTLKVEEITGPSSDEDLHSEEENGIGVVEENDFRDDSYN